MDLFEGIIRTHPRGFGFVAVAGMQDVFIPKPYISDAVDGDRVEIEVTSHTGRGGKGPEGRVVQVLERGRTQLGALITSIKGTTAEAYAPLLGIDQTVLVDLGKKKTKEGDRVVAEIKSWGNEIETKLVEVIGHIDDPSKDIQAACANFELKVNFPEEALKEADTIGTKVTAKDRKGRADLREMVTITIDPASAKDFDDALSLSKNQEGHYLLSVHIADVTHYVQPGSALDDEARKRCNSTYFPGSVVPMLPPSLCDNLCSLRPKVDRLAVTVHMEFDPSGKQLNHQIERSVIHSQQRFSYEEAKEILDGKKSPYSKLLGLMAELCGKLKTQRKERGCVEFAMPEIVVQVDENGEPTGTTKVEYDITHQMVEEFMLKANETVATHLTDLGRGLTYRVHDEPGAADLEPFCRMARALGFPMDDRPTMQDLQELFDKAAKTPYGAHLTVAYIRSMKMAIYSSDNIGHYGLSLEHYCHFTSPIRRYADLLVHRILLENAYSEEEISEIAHACSEQERISSRAENSVLRLKKLRYLLEAESDRWEAVISEVKPQGFAFELVDLMFDGFIHISQIGQDYYRFNEERLTLSGDRSGETFRSGQPIQVELMEADLGTGEAEWQFLSKI